MKKLLVLLLAAALCVSMLAACGSSEEESKPEESKTEQSTAENSGSTDDSSEPAGNADMVDFTILGADDWTYMTLETDMEEFYSWKDFRKMMADNGLNLVVEYVQGDQYQTTLQTRFGTKTDLPMYASFYNFPENDVLDLAKAGIVQDILPMLDEGNGTAKAFFTESKYGTMAKNKVTTPEGQMYWVPNIYVSVLNDGTEGVGTNICVVIREDWLNAVGMEIPTTLDEYTAALEAFYGQDFSGAGAGVPGYHVYSYRLDTWADGMANWFGLVRGTVSVNWDTDEAISPWHQDTVTDYMNYVIDLYQKGLVDPEMVSDNTTLSSKTANNQVGASTTYALATTWEPTIDGHYDASKDAYNDNLTDTALYADIYPITAVEGVTPLLPLEDPYYMWDEFGFTSELPSLAVGAAFLDVYYSQESIDLINYGSLGNNYDLVDGEVVYKKYKASREQGSGEEVEFEADVLNKYLQEKADQRLSYGKILYSRTVTADMTFYQLEKATDECYTQIWPSQKADYQHETYDYGHWTSIDVSGTLSTASAEESQIYSDKWTNMYDASTEAMSALVTGLRSMDEFDAIVAELDALGLKDIEAVYQARHNRFIGK